MAKLGSMPDTAIISGLKGTVDFYYYKGIPVARAWPRSPGKQRAPAVAAQWPAWSVASKSWVKLSRAYQLDHATWCGHGRQNPRDLQMKSYLSNLYGPNDPAEVGNCQLLRYDWRDQGAFVLLRVWLDSPWVPVAVFSLNRPTLNLQAINDRGLYVVNRPVINFVSFGSKNPVNPLPSVFNSFTFNIWPKGQERWIHLYYHDGVQNNRSVTVPISYTRPI